MHEITYCKERFRASKKRWLMPGGLCSPFILCRIRSKLPGAQEVMLTQQNVHDKDGVRLLRQPVMPLVSMLRLLFMIGPHATVAEVVDELPEPIETAGAVYDRPRALLAEYGRNLAGLELMKQGRFSHVGMVDDQNNPVDPLTADFALLQQEVLTAELEKINSLLCGPCSCKLCCIGPDPGMVQEFFEIPLQPGELDSFPITRHDSAVSRHHRSGDEDELLLGRPALLSPGRTGPCSLAKRLEHDPAQRVGLPQS
jgi:hypothetical protein